MNRRSGEKFYTDFLTSRYSLPSKISHSVVTGEDASSLNESNFLGTVELLSKYGPLLKERFMKYRDLFRT